MFGRVRMYEMGFAVFVLGSLACNEPSIIGFRILQGIGGAFIMANSGAVIADLYPRELRGKAYGYTPVGWTMGAIIGIVPGGVIVTYISWRWIFWINVPVGVAALAVATRVLHDRAERSRRRLDLPGMITLGLGLFGVLWAMTRLANTAFDATVADYLTGGLVLIGVFVVVECRSAEWPRRPSTPSSPTPSRCGWWRAASSAASGRASDCPHPQRGPVVQAGLAR